ncbi:MAG: hypothetical protein HOP08_19830 [Cyclobacteriaceae bacterium]|nr:hypothetical protein [Cyclobacteriaceae bacterium]
MRLTNLIITFILLVSCGEKEAETQAIEFWGYSEFNDEFLAYTIEVPLGGEIIPYDGKKMEGWEEWERKIHVVYKDGSDIFITNQYTWGALNALIRIQIGDTTMTPNTKPIKKGMFNSTFFKEQRVNAIVVGYEFVPSDKLELFERCLKSLKESKELKRRILKEMDIVKDSTINNG